MGYIIGIDLGTTNSVVAVCDGREPRVLVTEEGQRVTPSVVTLEPDGTSSVGVVARRQQLTVPERTVASVKRIIGRRHADVRPWAAALPFELAESDNGDAAVRVDGRRVTPEEISARILAKLKRAAEAALGDDVDGAVITVPAYFDDAQRQATKRAGLIAGLDVRRIINEPTAAALAYGHRDHAMRLAVYDFGGGTFDVSILEIADGVIEVRATAGDVRLGGDDIDARVAELLVDLFNAEQGVDLRADRAAMQRVRDAAERAKVDLSHLTATEVTLPFLALTGAGPRHLRYTLTRARLEDLAADLIERTLVCCRQALADARLTPSEIDQILLVGGSTRMPAVEVAVRDLFGRAPNRTVNPDEAVALGAAIQGAVLSGGHHDLVLLDVTPLSLGVETRGGVFTPVIERNAVIPTRATRTFSTAADGQHAISVHVLQGERPMARDNRSLGRFELSGIPPRPRGEPRIDVELQLDANGVLSVSARERRTGAEAQVTLTNAGGLSPEEVERLVAEARRAERADEERRSLVERANALESTALALRRRARAVGPDLPEHVQRGVEDALATYDRAVAGEILSESRYLAINSELLAAAGEVEASSLDAAARRARQSPA